MSAPKRLTPEQEKSLVTSYSSGTTLRQLQDEFGVSAGTIRAAVQRQGGTLRPVGRPSTKAPAEASV